MNSSKQQIIQEIEAASGHLTRALDELARLPGPKCWATDFAAHTLSSYLTLTKGTVDLLREELAEYPLRDIHIWLDGLARGTVLMEQLVEQIRSGVAAPFDLKREEVVIATMVRRFCRLHAEDAARKGVRIEFDAAVSTSRTWVDRIVVASTLQELFAHALHRAPVDSVITVYVEELHDQIVCRIHDQGEALSPESCERLLQMDDMTAPESEDGHGLKLAAQSAERLGGRIRCECSAEGGCSIYFSLPKEQAPESVP